MSKKQATLGQYAKKKENTTRRSWDTRTEPRPAWANDAWWHEQQGHVMIYGVHEWVETHAIACPDCGCATHDRCQDEHGGMVVRCARCGVVDTLFSKYHPENLPSTCPSIIIDREHGKRVYFDKEFTFTPREIRAAQERARALREHVAAGGKLHFEDESEDDYFD